MKNLVKAIFLIIFAQPSLGIDAQILASKLICFEAQRWVGVKEEADNKGAFIEMFQKAVDGQSLEEPWCMSFLQFCLKKTEECIEAILPDALFIKSELFRSENCLETWNKSKSQRSAIPGIGYFCVWQRFKNGDGTAEGHAGIVVELSGDKIKVIEANTFPQVPHGGIERNGSGVYLKEYTLGQMNREPLRFKGFLSLW